MDFDSSNFKLIRNDLFENRAHLLESLLDPEKSEEKSDKKKKNKSAKKSKTKMKKSLSKEKLKIKGKKLFANFGLDLDKFKFLMLKMLYRNSDEVKKIGESIGEDGLNRLERNSRRRAKRKIMELSQEVSEVKENTKNIKGGINKFNKPNSDGVKTPDKNDSAMKVTRDEMYQNKDINIKNLNQTPESSKNPKTSKSDTKKLKTSVSKKIPNSDPSHIRPQASFETNEIPKIRLPTPGFVPRRRLYRNIKMYQNRKRSFSETDLSISTQSDSKKPCKKKNYKRKKIEEEAVQTGEDVEKNNKRYGKNDKFGKFEKKRENGRCERMMVKGRGGKKIEIRTTRFNNRNVNVKTLQNQCKIENQVNIGFFLNNSAIFKVFKFSFYSH